MYVNLFCNLWMTIVMMTQPMPNENIIMTVRGPIPASEFGKTLVHEHAMCDFIGAEETGRHRYNPDAVVETVLPFLQAIRERGFVGFVDCTPAYIGRDGEVLHRLAELTDSHILTNTGYYGAAGDKFIPSHAFTETADQLAARWVEEWERGIDDTKIKPGFIKIGVAPGTLSEIDQKLVQAGAKAMMHSNCPIYPGNAKYPIPVNIPIIIHIETMIYSPTIIATKSGRRFR